MAELNNNTADAIKEIFSNCRVIFPPRSKSVRRDSTSQQITAPIHHADYLDHVKKGPATARSTDAMLVRSLPALLRFLPSLVFFR